MDIIDRIVGMMDRVEAADRRADWAVRQAEELREERDDLLAENAALREAIPPVLRLAEQFLKASGYDPDDMQSIEALRAALARRDEGVGACTRDTSALRVR